MFIRVFLLLSASLYLFGATTLYVSPTGADRAAGT